MVNTKKNLLSKRQSNTRYYEQSLSWIHAYTDRLFFCFIMTNTRQAAVTHTQVIHNSVNNHTNPDHYLFYNDVYTGELLWFNTCVDHIQFGYNANNYLRSAAANHTYKLFSTKTCSRRRQCKRLISCISMGDPSIICYVLKVDSHAETVT
jgi:hypothetical protein